MIKTHRPSARLLVVDDEMAALNSARRTLRLHGFENVATCNDSREALSCVRDAPPDLVVLDLIMPHVSGETLLVEFKRLFPDLPVIVVTAECELDTAVGCMKLGAADFLVKPVSAERMATTVARALEEHAVRSDYSRLSERFWSDELEQPEAFEQLVTAHSSMLRVFRFLEAVAESSNSVLLMGETGTGKELLAKALHEISRPGAPFVAVNVAGLDDTLFADTLFGHAAGAYTGAESKRGGMIERAANGTLFLDEIGDLSEASQVKLLRLLQEHEYFPLGTDEPKTLRARVVAATHKGPATLRKDLYYRLRSFVVKVPPLREREGDLPLLVEHFLGLAARELGQAKPTVPTELYSYLGNHDWPGNVRELSAVVFEAVARHEQGIMRVEDFLQNLEVEPPAVIETRESLLFPKPLPSLKEVEEAAFEEALKRAQGNQSAAAKMLGVSRPTMGRFVQRRRHVDADLP